MSGAHHHLLQSSQMLPPPGRRVPWEGKERGGGEGKERGGGEGRRGGKEERKWEQRSAQFTQFPTLGMTQFVSPYPAHIGGNAGLTQQP